MINSIINFIVEIKNKILHWSFTFYKEETFRKNKCYCIQFSKWSWEESFTIFNINMSFSYKRDHGGFDFDINIFNFNFMVNVNDTRHWCEECNKYADDTCYKLKHMEY